MRAVQALRAVRGLAVRPKRLIVISLAALALILAAGVTVWLVLRTRPIFSSAITSQLNFTAYFPKPLVTGTYLDATTIKVTGGILFFKLDYDHYAISVVEQSAPQDPPDLASLVGFTKLSSDAGSAVIGQSPTGLTVIALNATTLVTLSSPKQLPSRILTSTVQNLHAL